MFTDKYCNWELAKKFASLKGDEDNPFINALIFAASRKIDNYTHVYWGPSAVLADEIINPIGGWNNIFYTKWAPILSISSLVDDTKTYVVDTDYVIFAEDGRVQLKDLTSSSIRPSFSTAPAALKATYSVGQGSNKAVDFLKGVAAPEDIQLACAMIVGSWYREPDREGISSVTESTAGATVAYRHRDIPDKAKSLLNEHVRHIF